MRFDSVLSLTNVANVLTLTTLALFAHETESQFTQEIDFDSEWTFDKLMTGDVDPIIIGSVTPKLVGDNFELAINVEETQCCLTETHICNLPTVTQFVDTCPMAFTFSVSVSDVYNFGCTGVDSFIVSGHATIVCDSELGQTSTSDGTTNEFTYSAIYETEIVCRLTPVPGQCLVCSELEDCEDANSVSDQGYSNAGTAISAASQSSDSGQLSTALASMSNAFTSTADQLDLVSSDVGSETIDAHTTMGEALDLAATAMASNDYQGVRNGLHGFIVALESVANIESNIAANVSSAIQEIKLAVRTADLIASPEALNSAFAFFTEVLEEAQRPMEELIEAVSAIMSITDPEILGAMGLDDPTAMEDLQNLTQALVDSDVVDFVGSVGSDISAFLNDAVFSTIADALGKAGAFLTGPGSGRKLGISGRPVENGRMIFVEENEDANRRLDACEYDCQNDDDCKDCYACDLRVGVGAFDPDELDDVSTLLEVITRAPRMTPGAGRQVRKAMKGLINVLRANRPKLYVKVCWEECIFSCCYIFWDESECEKKESGWIFLTPPRPFDAVGFWPPIAQWNQQITQHMRNEIDRAVTNNCGK